MNPGATDEAARYWAVQLDFAPLSADQQAALDAWLAADERRSGALLRMQGVLSYFDKAKALGNAQPVADKDGIDDAIPHLDEHGIGRRVPRRMIAAALAGAIAISGAGGWWASRPQIQEFATARGEVRRVPLGEGSLAAINTDSRIKVAFRTAERAVTLEHGEAWFQVAHDRARPFIVTAGDVRVRAVGTAFAVAETNAGVEVQVTQGVVEAWVIGKEQALTRIAAGSRALLSAESTATPASAPVSASASIERSLAWRRGEIAFDGEPLATAVAEFNHYNDTQLVVGDRALSTEPVVGYFTATEPLEFARAFARLIDAHAVVDGKTIRIEKNTR